MMFSYIPSANRKRHTLIKQSGRALWLTSVCLLAMGMSYAAFGDISYNNFTNTGGMVLNNATKSGDRLRIIKDGTGNVAATAWYEVAQEVASGFQTTFQYKLTYGGSPADGFAFVLYSGPAGTGALGATGGGLGYSGLSNNLAIEFDNYLSGDEQALGKHIAVQTNGAGTNDATHNLAGATKGAVAATLDQNTHTVKIVYTPGTPGTIAVYHDNMATPVLTVNYDLATIGLGSLPTNPTVRCTSHMLYEPMNIRTLDVTWTGAVTHAGAAYAGFSGGTGGLTETAEILNWSFAATPPTPAPAVAGYSFLLDDQPGTAPDTTIDPYNGDDPYSMTYTGLVDGAYYFHLRTGDDQAHWSPATHLGPFIVSATGGTLPVAGPIGLVLLGAGLALAGIRRIRRR